MTFPKSDNAVKPRSQPCLDSPLTRGKVELGQEKAISLEEENRCVRHFHMVALSTVQYNPTLKLFYDKLRDSGKSFKLAITAIMRKMIVALNSMAKNNSTWVAKNP